MTGRKRILGLAGWLLVVFAAAGLGAIASSGAAEFYGRLDRPDWAPPSELFSPVWTVLYLLNGVAAWLVWRREGFAGARGALTLFLVQLAANAAWSWLFFGLRSGAIAFIEVVVLWALIVATIVVFRRVSRIAALLLLPYLAWVTYAAALTLALWRANPAVLG